jgi:hypothetical protein
MLCQLLMHLQSVMQLLQLQQMGPLEQIAQA